MKIEDGVPKLKKTFLTTQFTYKKKKKKTKWN